MADTGTAVATTVCPDPGPDPGRNSPAPCKAISDSEQQSAAHLRNSMIAANELTPLSVVWPRGLLSVYHCAVTHYYLPYPALPSPPLLAGPLSPPPFPPPPLYPSPLPLSPPLLGLGMFTQAGTREPAADTAAPTSTSWAVAGKWLGIAPPCHQARESK